MPDAVIQPLEVFILDSDFKRLTGSIPYDSLVWRRRYYGVGEFQMQVRSSLYSTDWAYVYCDDRPETGIIQKVEYDDTTEGPRNGEDTITVSGFFLEEILNRLVFLVEEYETQEIKHVVPKPTRLSVSKPRFKVDSDGSYYSVWNNGTINNLMTGESARVEDSQDLMAGLTDADIGLGKGMYEQTFTSDQGPYTVGLYSTNFSYVSDDGRLNVLTSSDKQVASYDIVGDPSSGLILYKDDDGSVKWVNGAVESYADTYRRKTQRWESLQADEDGNHYWMEYRDVEGPWMLRTDIDDLKTPQDNVQWILKMAEKTFEGNFTYDKVTFEGETKTLAPSLSRMGDFFYGELQSVEASLRVLYHFESDQMVFQLWRGLDRTQDGGGQTPVALAAPTVASAVTLSDGPTLPSGYTQLEYIESTGTQYIDTGFVPDQDTRVVFHAVPMSIEETSYGKGFIPYGAGLASGNRAFELYTSGSHYEFNYGSALEFLGTAVVGIDMYVDHDKNHVEFTQGSQSESADLPASTFTAPVTMTVFGIHRSQAFEGHNVLPGHMRLMDFKVYDNGSLVRDFIPAKRVSDEKVGLYDLVGGSFYTNQGTGEFMAGPADVEPGYVPDAYTELDYIASTGTQYIDTGFTPNQDTRLVMDIESDSVMPEQHVAGARTANRSNQFAVMITGQLIWRTDYGSDQVSMNGAPRQGRFTIDKNKALTTIGSVSATNQAQTFSAGYTLYLFGVNTAGNITQYATIKLHGSQVYDNGTLVRDLVPARRQSDSVVGLYDTVTGTFFGNSGTGAFVAGPVVSIADSLAYDPNGGEGSMDPTPGYVGDAVVVEANGFTRDGHTFRVWNTQADGGGTDYAPLSEYTLTAGADVLFAQWDEVPEPPIPVPEGVGAPWAVFSDTWGTLYGFKASHDTSNYRNKVYILYDYEEPVWNSSGGVDVHRVQVDDDGDGAYDRWTNGTSGTVRRRGYWTVRLEDERPDAEVWLDLRGESPDFMDGLEFPAYDAPSTYDITKSDFDSWVEGLKTRGRTLLTSDYGDVDNLDTGTITTMRYLYDYDLGDKVDMAVEAIGMVKTARITEVEEVYESGSAEIHLTMGEELLTTDKKSLLV